MGCGVSWYEIAIPVAVTIFTVTSTLLLINRYVDALRFQLFLKFDILTGKDDDQENLDDFDFDLFVSHRYVPQIANEMYQTSMHSSRMRTAHLLTISLMYPGGGCLPRGSVCPIACWDTPPVNRMTDRCKNISLPQTSFASCNNF